MFSIIQQNIENTLKTLNDHCYYNYDKPFNEQKIGGIAPNEEQQVLIEKGLEKSKQIQEHLEQALALLQEEKEIITLLFHSSKEK